MAVVAFQTLHRDSGTQIHPGVTHHLSGDLTDHPTQCTHQGARTAFGDGHRQIQIAAHRGDFGADETRSDDQYPLWARLQRGGQCCGVLHSANRVHTLQCGFLRVGPGPGPGSGGDQQPTVGHLVAVGQFHGVVEPVQCDRRDPEAPVGVYPA